MTIATEHHALLAGHLRDELARHEHAIRCAREEYGACTRLTAPWWKLQVIPHDHKCAAERIRADLWAMGERE